MENWLSPMNKAILIRAFREKAAQVTLRDGRKFKMKYKTQPLGVSKDNVEMVYIEPVKGYAPAGWFPLKKVTDNQWLTESTDAPKENPNIYVQLLEEFFKSGVEGVDVMEEWPALTGKLNTTVRQGFASALIQRGKRAGNTEVRTIDGRVYILKDTNVD